MWKKNTGMIVLLGIAMIILAACAQNDQTTEGLTPEPPGAMEPEEDVPVTGEETPEEAGTPVSEAEEAGETPIAEAEATETKEPLGAEEGEMTPTAEETEETPTAEEEETPAAEEAADTPTAEAEDTTTPEDGAEAEGVDLAQGEQIFANNCSPCHGQQGQGQQAYPALAGNEFVTGDPDQVIQTVLQGRGGMPAFGDQLSDQEIANVISYIRNSWGNEASQVTPDQVAAQR